MSIELKPVGSSNVKAVGYDPATKTLAVEFHSGGVYHYEGVEPEKHAALMGDGVKGHSVGKHFHAHIRNAHKATKIEPEKG